MKYGNRDLDRIVSIKEKSFGDKLKELQFAVNMATAIDLPGKAMARAYASQTVFGELSPIAYVFFERAYELGGEDVKPEASVIIGSDEESIAELLSNIPEDELPGSMREKKVKVSGNRKKPVINLYPLQRINVVKGSGPNFSKYTNRWGTTEVWKTDEGKYRLIITANNQPNFNIGNTMNFYFENKLVTWIMEDYIENEFMGNLAPLYGKSILSYNYE